MSREEILETLKAQKGIIFALPAIVSRIMYVSSYFKEKGEDEKEMPRNIKSGGRREWRWEGRRVGRGEARGMEEEKREEEGGGKGGGSVNIDIYHVNERSSPI